MRLYLFRQWCYFIRKSAPVSYRYSFEDLLALLHGHAPAKVDAVALHRRRVEHGHLSVGLKIHCLGDGSQFSTLRVLEERKKFCSRLRQPEDTAHQRKGCRVTRQSNPKRA